MTLPLLCNPNTPRAQSLTGHGTFALLYMSCNGHHSMLQNEAMWHCMHYMYYCRCAFTVHGVTYTPHSPTHEFPRALRGDKHNCEAQIAQNHCTLWKYFNLVGRKLQQLLGCGSTVSHVFRAVNLLTNIKECFHTPTTRMKEPQFHVLTIQSVIREGYGELQFLNLHSDHTTPTTQRTPYHT